MALLGSLPQFQIKDDWSIFQERIEQYFEANSVKETKKVAILITVLEANVYKTLRDLCYPILPKDKSYKEICDILNGRFMHITSIFKERKCFYQIVQKEEESIIEWLQRIKSAAVNCKFENNLGFVITDKFVTGLWNEEIAFRLFEEDPNLVNFEKLLNIALAKEATLKERKKDLHYLERSKKVFNKNKDNKVINNKESIILKCKYCGRTGHDFSKCLAKSYTCFKCGKLGHAAAVCSEKKNKYIDIETDTDVDIEKEMENLSFFNLKGNKSHPLLCSVKVNGIPLTFEIDTGAAISAISSEMYYKYLGNIELQHSNILLRLYNGNVIKPLGSVNVVIEIDNVSRDCKLLVVENGGPPLFGRDLFNIFNWSINKKEDNTCYNNVMHVSKESLELLLDEYQHLFSEELGTFKYEKINLKVKENTVPIFCKPRNLPLAYKAMVEKELERLEKENIIKKVSNSAWGTPLVPVLKKDGNIRLCADYKITVNKHLEDFKYPLPRIEELFAALQGGEQFTKLDLSQAYNQLLLEDSTKLLLAWSTHKGIYALERLPFGTKPACSIFQSIVEKTLQGIPNVINFLDDIVVTGKNKNEHLTNLKMVFSRLSDAGLKIKSNKCSFLQNEISYLGYIIDKFGLKRDPEKIKSIINAPRPKNITQVKSFAGMINYYGKFIPALAQIMKPMYHLLSKGVDFKWGKDQEEAFVKAKKAMISETVLSHFNPNLPIILCCDASKDGIGAVLLHAFADGEKPVAFASRVFMPAEMNYSMLDKEALALYYGVKKFAQYLMGYKFILKTDHKPLTYLFGEKKGIPQMAAGRLQRWAVYLSGFDFDIKYIKGSDNCSADCLSRLPIKINYIDEPDTSYLNFVQSEVPVDIKTIQEETSNDLQLVQVMKFIKNGWPENVINKDFQCFSRKKLELYEEKGIIMWGHRVVIPKKLRNRILAQLHIAHTGINKMKSMARAYLWWPNLDKDIECLIQNCEACCKARPDPPKAKVISYDMPQEVFERIHIDFFGPIRNKYFFVIIDSYSKWPEVYEMNSMTTINTLEKLKETCARYGIPKKIISDNGAQFTSIEFKKFCELNGIKHITIPPFHPASNGAAENLVGSIKVGLTKAFNDDRNIGKSINTILCTYLFNYRCTIHCTTNCTPSEKMYGRHIRTWLDLIRPEKNKIFIQQNIAKKGRDITFSVGEEVYIRDYRKVNQKLWVKGTVIKVLGPRAYQCRVDGTELIWKRHVNQIIKGGTSELTSELALPMAAKEAGIKRLDGKECDVSEIE